MSRKEKWKEAGKNIGHAFGDFGKAMATTTKVIFTDETNIDENGNSKIKESWKKMGKDFGKAGKSVGKAAKETVNPTSEESKKEEEVIDVEFEEKK